MQVSYGKLTVNDGKEMGEQRLCHRGPTYVEVGPLMTTRSGEQGRQSWGAAAPLNILLGGPSIIRAPQ